MNKWVRTPKHILRMDALRHAVNKFPPGTFIECGAGTGDFTRFFLESGFKGSVYDIDKRTLQILEKNLENYNNVSILAGLDALPKNSFDYLFAFEVLEHIPDDYSALSLWTEFLRDRGTIVVSVPAHQRKFSQEDRRIGHVRRYDRRALFDLLAKTGYENICIISYGFPLGNFTRLGKNIFNALRQDSSPGKLNQRDRSIESGIKRDEMENRLQFLFNRRTIAPFAWLQRYFFRFDLGDGYIATGTKSPQS
jgi:SAM-dependent methyltransferase